jgi:uncharacterized protein (DUF1501 family)
MNRLLGLLPRPATQAIALAPTVPLALRGAQEVTSYAPSALPQASDDLLARVQQLYAHDQQLHALWSAAMDARGRAAGLEGQRRDPATVGRIAAGFLAQPDGPRLAMVETGGWDTHSGQAARLAQQLRALDTLLAALRDGLGTAWAQTTVLLADWPGLAPADLHEGRDLRPTLGLDALIAAAAADTFRLDREQVARVLFPSLQPGVDGLPALTRS